MLGKILEYLFLIGIISVFGGIFCFFKAKRLERRSYKNFLQSGFWYSIHGRDGRTEEEMRKDGRWLILIGIVLMAISFALYMLILVK